MSLMESIQLPLGSMMPKFCLQNPHGDTFDSDKLFGPKGLLVIITCNHCPYAIAVWERLIRLSGHAKNLGIKTVAINPNINPDYPDDAPEKMIDKAKELGMDFPYLVDKSQDVARRFQAQCTPDIYLYDNTQRLAYHGRVDDNWQDESAVTKEELKMGLEALANEQPIDPNQLPSMGCSIKWSS